MLGLGYIGLPTAAVFADRGLDVIGVDVNADVIGKVNRGTPHFGEPNLDALLRRVVENGKLRATATPEPADAFLIAVPTPFRDGHKADISYVEAAAEAIAPVLAAGNLVILESTSPVGTTERMAAILAAARPDLRFPAGHGELSDIRIAHCPERVLPGRILDEVVNNDRVIGGLTRKCAQQAMALYKIVVAGDCHLTTARTAEMAKLSENAFRDVNIAFANELSVICDRLGIDVWDMIRLANLHPRVGILRPGPGVGGHCIAVDPWFIVESAPEDAVLIRAARERNDGMPARVVDKVRQRVATMAHRPVIACLGLAYKADVDDLRESPAVDVVVRLVAADLGEILVVEPHVSALPPTLDDLGLTLTDFDAALGRADVVLLLVDHRVFAKVGREQLRDKAVIDTRGIW